MSDVAIVGLDLAKNVFQVHGITADYGDMLRRQLRRAQVVALFERLPRCLVGMEACASAHYWVRKLDALGHHVRADAARI